MKVIKIIVCSLAVILLGLGGYGYYLSTNGKVEEPKKEEKQEQKEITDNEESKKEDVVIKEKDTTDNNDETDEAEEESYEEEDFEDGYINEYHLERCIRNIGCKYTLKANKKTYNIELKNVKSDSSQDDYRNFNDFTFDLYINGKLITKYTKENLEYLTRIRFENYNSYLIIQGITDYAGGILSKIINYDGKIIYEGKNYEFVELNDNNFDLYTKKTWFDDIGAVDVMCDNEYNIDSVDSTWEEYYKNCTIENDELILGEKVVVTFKEEILNSNTENCQDEWSAGTYGCYDLTKCENNFTKDCICKLEKLEVNDEDEY